MSRIAKQPIVLPQGVDVAIQGRDITVKGGKGVLNLTLHPTVRLEQEANSLQVVAQSMTSEHRAFAGTMRALVNNMVTGVSQGFERRLQLVGVGYRAQAQGEVLNLTLGFSHPVEYRIPEGVTIETPSQTDIVVRGTDKQLVGAVAAKIRSFRPPEPYKGKGVRYADERIIMKEAKKK